MPATTDPPGTTRSGSSWPCARNPTARSRSSSSGLALVFGRDRHLEAERAKAARDQPRCQTGPGLLRDHLAHYPAYEKRWNDWRTRSENSFRNYDVIEFIPRLELVPHASKWKRLLGYGLMRDPASPAESEPEPAGFVRLSAAAGSLAPEPDEHHRDLWVITPSLPAGPPLLEPPSAPKTP